jgi:hypothetical protein
MLLTDLKGLLYLFLLFLGLIKLALVGFFLNGINAYINWIEAKIKSIL